MQSGTLPLAGPGGYLQSLATVTDSDFIIGKIAGRILLPGIARQLPGPHARIATTNVPMLTGSTPPLEGTGLRLESGHKGIRGILPDFREMPVAYIAEIVIPPEGIGMDIPQVIDIGNIYPGGIASPLL